MTTNMTTNNPDTLWVAHGSEELEEADEPPEITLKKQQFTANDFQRTTIRPPTEKSSLLTKAINGNSDDDLYTPQTISRPMANTQRRRSLVSNISLASTADLTSDTGFTSPSRPNTPSPPLPEMAMLRLHDGRAAEPTHVSLLGAAVRLQQGKTEEPRKRSIQFACVAKPVVQEQPPRSQPMAKAPSAQEAPRKSCIKFACPARPASTQNTPPRYTENCAKKDATPKAESPSTPKRMSALAFAAPRQVTPRRHSMSRPRFLRADSSDLVTDSSQFHEFASDKERANRRSKRVRYAEEAPDLPDSTDFVCGTLDEDRPLEEAYLSCLAARRNEKLRVIPQDIDPSFPASEPEEENEGEIFNPVHHSSDEDDEFFQGKMEDLHQERDRPRRRRKSEHASPKRFRSPPPKRHHSPPPKVRGRSPKPLFDRQSPRKAKSPAPMRKPITTPLGSPRCGQVNFNLAGRPGLTHTKSLPRGGAMCHQRKQARHKVKYDNDTHIRGAIDIVKGLESKRQRRKEKFHQKYCNRARRGQIPERKPVPGRGTERMRELGLLMAGKKDQTNYVLSI
ncbi:hypothetical protein FPRO06_02262 [Fusarium proliferatum]|uniref:Uncharacterized protein n=1 Tax=Gibberella intermedia TaxID=948311 RepID=A0A365MM73_GIBIN|nr:hypothetical protein FPRO03_02457 [Fusarium proliferatum]KAG4267842.1 hypothetical protein FPRO04_04258 [Fusarium proliferatum]KAG4290376.1 hypothetical protein FPRO06_02262 [Fusarium proliferatum]RBA09607.1 hypothetical protein FPRO05_06744 [Fusarium proliferatum]